MIIIFTSPVEAVAKYCNERVCVCLFVHRPRGVVLNTETTDNHRKERKNCRGIYVSVLL